MEYETATLAGGCFWCTEAVFRRLKGVISVTSGYAGGVGQEPTYEQVSSGGTGFAEAVQIKFDPAVITFGKILDIFWATHDPTTLNRQGNDIGTQYRSVIFYQDQKQREIAEESKSRLGQDLPANVVTEITPFTNFYTAEQYHQRYYEQNRQTNPYCSLIISPKIHKLIEQFNTHVKDEYKITEAY